MSHEPLPEREIRQRMVNGFKWAVVGKLFITGFSWFSTIFMVRLLSPQDYGLQSMWEAPVGLAILLCVSCLDQAIIRHRVQQKESLSEVFGILLILSLFAFTGLYLSAPYIAKYFNAPQLELILKILCVLVLISPFRVIPNALLDLQMKFKLKAKVDIVSTTLATLIGLASAVMGAGVWALIVVLICESVARLILLSIYQPWMVRPSFGFLHSKPILQTARSLLIGSVIVFAGSYSSNVLAAPILGKEQMGILVMGVTFTFIPLVKLMPVLNQVLFSTYANLGDERDVKKYLLHAVELGSMLIVPIAFGLVLTAPEFVPVVLGVQWIGAVLLLSVLPLQLPLRLLSELFITALNARGYSSELNKIRILTTLLYVSLTIPAAMSSGLVGLIVLSFFARTLEIVLIARCVKRFIFVGYAEAFLAIRQSFICGFLMVIAILVVALLIVQIESTWLKLTIKVFVGVIVYLLVSWVFFRPRIKELFMHFRRVKNNRNAFT